MNDYGRLQVLSSFVHVINRVGLFCHAYCRMGQCVGSEQAQYRIFVVQGCGMAAVIGSSSQGRCIGVSRTSWRSVSLTQQLLRCLVGPRADVPRSSRISLRCRSIQFRVNIGRR